MTKRTKKSHMTVETSGEGSWSEEALPLREQSRAWPLITHLSIQEPQPKILTKPRGRRNAEGGIRSRSQRASARREPDIWVS